MISYIFNASLLFSFVFGFFVLSEFAKDVLFIKQAGIFALRSHYIENNYIETLESFSKKTAQKEFDFQSSKVTENKTETRLNLNAVDIKPIINSQLFKKLDSQQFEYFYLGDAK